MSVARGIVALAACLVPRDRRVAWREEWLAEVWQLEHREIGVIRRGAATMRFALGSVGHACTLRRLARRTIIHSRRHPMQSLSRDLKQAFRTFRRAPGFAFIVILITALGIGATTAVFSVVDGVMFRTLPYRNADGLVMVGSTSSRFPGLAPVNPMDFFDWRRENTVFSHLSAIDSYTFDLVDGDEPLRIEGAAVTEEFFDMLGARPVLGRTFRAGDDVASGERIVVLSYDFWQQRFGGDSAVIGRRIFTADHGYTVVGVAGRGFRHPEALWSSDVEIWMPLSFIENPLTSRGARFLQVIGRLRPDATIEDARVEMDQIGRGLAELYPQNVDRLPIIEPLHQETVGAVGQPLLMLLGAVSVLLLIACVNIANLMLARATLRVREMALRRALGAGMARIYLQLLTEGVALAVVGGLLGTTLAYGAVALFKRADPVGLPRIGDISVDVRVLAFAVGLSIVAGIVFALVPAARLARSSQMAVLREQNDGEVGSSRVALRYALVGAELAMAVMLVIGAGLFARSLVNLRAVDPGFDPVGAVTLTVNLSDKYDTPERRIQHLEALASRFRGIPGVENVAYTSSLPFSGDRWITGFRVEGVDPGAEPQVADYSRVGPGYFTAMRIRVVEGRDFTASDRAGQPEVMIVSESFAREFLGGPDAVGRRIGTRGMTEETWYTVVGVVRDVSRNGLDGTPDPEFYFSALQRSTATAQYMVRTTGSAEVVVSGMRNRAWELDPQMPLRFDSLEGALVDAVSQPRFLAMMLVTFAGLALFLAAVGVYGTMAYVVGQRRHEIGIRMALGASSREVVRMVVGRALVVTAVGLTFGLVGASLVSRLVDGLLFGVTSGDALTYLIATGFLAIVALAASFLPARRAGRADPVTALRME